MLLVQGSQCCGESPPGVGGDGFQGIAAGQTHHRVRVEGLDHGGRLVQGAYDDVAGKYGRDRRVRGDGFVRQRRPAGAQDELRLDVDVELVLERRRDVDLREDAEALLTECGANGFHGFVVTTPQRRRHRVCHQALLEVASARAFSMSRARTASISCSSAAAGSAPGCANTSDPSLKAIRVGIDLIPAAPARAGSASVSTLPKTTSGWFADACS